MDWKRPVVSLKSHEKLKSAQGRVSADSLIDESISTSGQLSTHTQTQIASAKKFFYFALSFHRKPAKTVSGPVIRSGMGNNSEALL